MTGLPWIDCLRLGRRLFAGSWEVGLPYPAGRRLFCAGPRRIGEELEKKLTEGGTGETAVHRGAL